MPAPRRLGSGPTTLVQHLTEQAPTKAVQQSIPISRYFQSAELVLRQAELYRVEHNEEQQYVMLMRLASLVIETIPKHQDFSKADSKYVRLRKLLVDKYFPQLESLKATLTIKHISEPVAHSRNRPADAVLLSTSNLPGVNWAASGAAVAAAAVAGTAAGAAPAADYASFKVDDLLDIIQHGPSAGLPPSAGINSITTGAGPTTALLQPQGSGAPAIPEYQPRYNVSGSSTDAMRHTLYMSPSIARPESRGTPAVARSGSVGIYPSQPQQSSPAGLPLPPRYPDVREFSQLSLSGSQSQHQQYSPSPSAGPSLGPQEVGVTLVDPMSAMPDTCGSHQNGSHNAPSAPPLPLEGQAQAPPPPPPPPQQQQLATQSSGGLKEVAKRAQLRDVHVSVALMEEFLAYARSNTSRGIESCGILAGRLSANDSIFTITTLIIPKQQGTSDTVQALNEEEIFEVQFSQELYPLGWIHTHPTQTCFLSSVDVHTQCGYQTMLDEAVAIVMAPTDRSKKCGIFRLSTPGGLTLVQRCNLRGFHAHPDTHTGQELYELCGHVYLNPRAKHSVIDLR